MRTILKEVLTPEVRVHMGDALATLGRKIGLTNEDFAVFEQVRDKTSAEPMKFE